MSSVVLLVARRIRFEWDTFGSRLASLAFTCLVVYWVLALPTSALGKNSPCVHFDVAQLASCRRLPAKEVTARKLHVGSGEMLIETTFNTSALIGYGHDDRIRQLLFVVESPTRSLRVVDFSPKTELTTRYAGTIERNTAQDETHNMGVNASLSPHHAATAHGTLSSGNSNRESLKFQLRPPNELLASSGTVARRTAVFFKFVDSPQTTLDGDRRLVVVFRVDRHWRADYVHLRCAAFQSRQTSSRPICGSSEFLVPLYLAGDAAARDAANRLAQHDMHLRRVASQLSRQPTRPQSLVEKLTMLVGKNPHPKWPENWLHQVMSRPAIAKSPDFVEHLPEDAQAAIATFNDARRRLADLQATNETVLTAAGDSALVNSGE